MRIFLYMFLSLGLCSCASTSKVAVKEKLLPLAISNQQAKQVSTSTDALSLEDFKQSLLHDSVASAQTIDDFFSRVVFRANLLELMDRPSTAKPWYQYIKHVPLDYLCRNGVNFYRQHQAALKKVSQETGVAPEYIVAVLGVETRYGELKGSYRVADSLYTYAFYYPRRAAFFQQELRDFFQLYQEQGRDPFSYLGSYAGAMGYPQFMPSSYRRWAVSYGQTKYPDIWNNAQDAIASVANYLQKQGWRKNFAVVYPVLLQDQSIAHTLFAKRINFDYHFAQVKRQGVLSNAPLQDQDMVGLFVLQTGPSQWSYYLGSNNLYALWHYNHSANYIMLVDRLANLIRAEVSF